MCGLGGRPPTPWRGGTAAPPPPAPALGTPLSASILGTRHWVTGGGVGPSRWRRRRRRTVATHAPPGGTCSTGGSLGPFPSCPPGEVRERAGGGARGPSRVGGCAAGCCWRRGRAWCDSHVGDATCWQGGRPAGFLFPVSPHPPCAPVWGGWLRGGRPRCWLGGEGWGAAATPRAVSPVLETGVRGGAAGRARCLLFLCPFCDGEG